MHSSDRWNPMCGHVESTNIDHMLSLLITGAKETKWTYVHKPYFAARSVSLARFSPVSGSSGAIFRLRTTQYKNTFFVKHPCVHIHHCRSMLPERLREITVRPNGLASHKKSNTIQSGFSRHRSWKTHRASWQKPSDLILVQSKAFRRVT